MPSQARVNGADAPASGRGRQRLKLGAIGYLNARHGVDTDADLAYAARKRLCLRAVEFWEAIHGTPLKGRRIDLWDQYDRQIQLAAIAYGSARHGIDADVGMTREGLADLCQEAINFVEALPKEEPVKRQIDPRLQIGG